ncbi:hypothetical protein [Lysobacter gummosus]|uniref:hypothetical protein n=1 Tax=Lysobacter gummosus TaxID=262324 RepID=UPI00362B5C21
MLDQRQRNRTQFILLPGLRAHLRDDCVCAGWDYVVTRHMRICCESGCNPK